MSVDVDVRARVGRFDLDVSFSTDAPFTAIVGPSGAGKTLTLRLIAGLLRPDAGRVAVDGRALFDDRHGVDVPARSRRVGLVFQHHALFPHLDVARNIGFGLPDWDAGERTARVRALAQLVELEDRLDARPDELSGGQQQRVAVARALAPRPDLLLLDEPFAAVDTKLRERLRAGLQEALQTEGVRALLVTHDAADAAALADRVLVLEGGRCVATGGHELLNGR